MLTDSLPYLLFFGCILLTAGVVSFVAWRLLASKSRAHTEALQEIESLRNTLKSEHERRIIAEEKSQRVPNLEQTIDVQRQEMEERRSQVTSLDLQLKQERESTQQKVALLEKAQQEFQNAFKALSADALSKNNQNFLDLAKTTLGKFHETSKSDLKATEKAFTELVAPVKEALGNVNKRIEDVEKNRIGAYEGLKQQVSTLITSQKDLRSETANLVNALRAPSVRGRWGEMQLRRVVEMSGMSAHCDFSEQVNIEGDEGRLRPDMVVNLPNKKQIIIDAKAPLAAYLEALEAKTDSEKTARLKDHARQVRNHITQLSSRAYWDQLSKDGSTPEFVVLFLPGETFFTAALEHDPNLIEDGVQKNVIIATPATLIALLHAVAYGWRQESLAENAHEISELGRELYKRCADMGSHMSKLGRDLSAAVGSYNKTVGTIERRILPSARKFKELQAGTREDIPSLITVEQTTRDLQVEELIEHKVAS